MELGKRTIKIDTYFRLAAVLGVDTGPAFAGAERIQLVEGFEGG